MPRMQPKTARSDRSGLSPPAIWGFTKIRGTLFGVPIIRTIVIGVHIGVPLFGKLPIWGPYCRDCTTTSAGSG